MSLDNGDTFDEGTLLNQQLGVGAGKRPGPAGGLYIPKSGRLMYAGYAGRFDPGVSVCGTAIMVGRNGILQVLWGTHTMTRTKALRT